MYPECPPLDLLEALRQNGRYAAHSGRCRWREPAPAHCCEPTAARHWDARQGKEAGCSGRKKLPANVGRGAHGICGRRAGTDRQPSARRKQEHTSSGAARHPQLGGGLGAYCSSRTDWRPCPAAAATTPLGSRIGRPSTDRVRGARGAATVVATTAARPAAAGTSAAAAVAAVTSTAASLALSASSAAAAVQRVAMHERWQRLLRPRGGYGNLPPWLDRRTYHAVVFRLPRCELHLLPTTTTFTAAATFAPFTAAVALSAAWLSAAAPTHVSS